MCRATSSTSGSVERGSTMPPAGNSPVPAEQDDQQEQAEQPLRHRVEARPPRSRRACRTGCRAASPPARRARRRSPAASTSAVPESRTVGQMRSLMTETTGVLLTPGRAEVEPRQALEVRPELLVPRQSRARGLRGSAAAARGRRCARAARTPSPGRRGCTRNRKKLMTTTNSRVASAVRSFRPTAPARSARRRRGAAPPPSAPAAVRRRAAAGCTEAAGRTAYSRSSALDRRRSTIRPTAAPTSTTAPPATPEPQAEAGVVGLAASARLTGVDVEVGVGAALEHERAAVGRLAHEVR